MSTSASSRLLATLLEYGGQTYAEEAAIRLADKPMPLFQLLTLCMLASKPIDASIAVAGARELFEAGIRTPKTVLRAQRGQMLRAFSRAHYVRYDESSATRLTDMAREVNLEYGGDLRKLADAAGHRTETARSLLQRFKGIGGTGADIFLREVQDIWTWTRPYFDDRAVSGAREVGLPTDTDRLVTLAPRSAARLAAALVRVSLDDALREKVRSAQ